MHVQKFSVADRVDKSQSSNQTTIIWDPQSVPSIDNERIMKENFCINPNGVRGVSRISARGVLKVRPHTKSGGAVHFRSDIRKVGGGGGGAIPLFGTKKILYR